MSTSVSQKVHVVLALVVLGGSAVLMQAAQARGWLQVIKKPLPIRKPLEDMNRSRLEPFKLITSEKFPPEAEEELGTKEYISWVIREPDTPDDESPTTPSTPRGRQVNLAVTYYTGVVDQVPHVAEECMTQGAFTLVDDDVIEMTVPSLDRAITVRRQSYYPPRDISVKTYVYYTICVNGDFYAKRLPARRRMADWSDTHLYYSKVEISFRGSSSASWERLDKRAADIFDRVLPELVEVHWPVRGSEKGGGASDSGPPTGGKSDLQRTADRV